MVFYQQDVLLVALGDGADGDGGELGLLLVHDVRRHVGGLAHEQLQAFVHLQASAAKVSEDKPVRFVLIIDLRSPKGPKQSIDIYSLRI